MNIRDLLNQIDLIESKNALLEAGLRLSTVIASIAGKETNDQERFKALSALAKENGLPGLYDPVTGQFVKIDGSTTNTADKETDKKLAYMGLIPDNAATSTYWGKVFGTSGEKYDTELRTTSGKTNAAYAREEREASLLAELKALIPKYLALKNKVRRKPSSGQAGRAEKVDNSLPSKVEKLSDGTTLRTYPDGIQTLYDPKNALDFAGSIEGSPGQRQVGSKGAPYKLPAGVKVIGESFQGLADSLRASFGILNEETVGAYAEKHPNIAGATIGGATTLAFPNYLGASVPKSLVGKIGTKALPGIAAGLSAADAYERAKRGDYIGAGLSGLSGALCLIPGVGVIPALVPDAINAWRDYKEGHGLIVDIQRATNKQGSAEDRLKDLQELLGVPQSGVLDSATRAKVMDYQRERKMPVTGNPNDIFKAANIQENEMTVAEVIAETKARLSLFEDDAPILFFKNSIVYALLPDGRLIDQEGNLINGKTLEIIKKQEVPLKEAGLGGFFKGGEELAKAIPDSIKSAVSWFKKAAPKMAPEAEEVSKAAGVESKATAAAAKEVGTVVKVGDQSYVWKGRNWYQITPGTRLPGRKATEIEAREAERAAGQSKAANDKVYEPKPAANEPAYKPGETPTTAAADTTKAAEKGTAAAVKPGEKAAADTAADATKSAEKPATDAAKEVPAQPSASGKIAPEVIKDVGDEVELGGKTYQWTAASKWAEVNVKTGKPFRYINDAGVIAKIEEKLLKIKNPGRDWSKIAGRAVVGGGALYGANELRKADIMPDDTDDVASGEEKPQGQTMPGLPGDQGHTGQAGHADDEAGLTPAEKEERRQAEADQADFEEIKQRINELFKELDQSTDPKIRAELPELRSQLY